MWWKLLLSNLWDYLRCLLGVCHRNIQLSSRAMLIPIVTQVIAAFCSKFSWKAKLKVSAYLLQLFSDLDWKVSFLFSSLHRKNALLKSSSSIEFDLNFFILFHFFLSQTISTLKIKAFKFPVRTFAEQFLNNKESWKLYLSSTRKPIDDLEWEDRNGKNKHL